MEIEAFVLDRTPESLDENVVEEAAPAVHADADALVQQALTKGKGGKLRAM